MSIDNRVKVRFKEILHKTEKATLFLIADSEVWIPNKLFRHMSGSAIKINRKIAIARKISFKELYHIPDQLEPKYNQKPIDDLIY